MNLFKLFFFYKLLGYIQYICMKIGRVTNKTHILYKNHNRTFFFNFGGHLRITRHYLYLDVM